MRHMNPDDGPDWQPTGEKRWRVLKRVKGYRMVRSEMEEVDMNSGDIRWIPLAHDYETQKAAAGFRKVPKYDRIEKDEGTTTEFFPWRSGTPPGEAPANG